MTENTNRGKIIYIDRSRIHSFNDNEDDIVDWYYEHEAYPDLDPDSPDYEAEVERRREEARKDIERYYLKAHENCLKDWEATKRFLMFWRWSLFRHPLSFWKRKETPADPGDQNQ